MRRAVVIALSAALASTQLDATARQVPAADDPAQSSLITRFLAGTGTPLSSYRGVRTLTAEARGGKMRARLVAETSLDPLNGFQYVVLSEEGSGTIRLKVLRAALEAERALHVDGETGRGAITPANYTFEVGAPSDDGLVPIALHPKRSDKLLIEGRVLVSEPDADLVRVEGVLVKRPSFWTRKVEVVRNYRRICGVRVPIGMESTAHILFAGKSTFAMQYEYESINGEAVPPGGSDVPTPHATPGHR